MNSSYRMPVRRCNPGDITSNLKEAVAESILQTVYHRIAGVGAHGEVISDAKPSSRLTSGFLLPANRDDLSLDDESSPIRITATGFDLMVLREGNGKIVVTPRFSIYIRLLPTAEELKQKKVTFRLVPEVDRSIRQEIKDRKKEAWELNCERFGNDRYSSEWKSLQDKISQEVHSKYGIQQISIPQEVVHEENGSDSDGEHGIEVNGFSIGPGDLNYPPADTVKAERPYEKWLRLEVTPDALSFDLSDSVKIEQSMQAANLAIVNALESRISEWVNDTSDLGGQSWGYPRGRKFTPYEIANWDTTINSIRSEFSSMSQDEKRRALAIPDLRIVWSVEINTDWANPIRDALHIALENRSGRPPRNYFAEIENSIFQVELTCKVPVHVHQYMQLDRVKPSYRFNRFLRYACLGFNCGVHEDSDGNNVILKTNWMPKYCLPRIEPIGHNIDCRFSALKNEHTSIESIKSIPEKYIEWINNLNIDVSEGISKSNQSAIGREQIKYKRDVASWQREASMIQRGIELLERSRKANKDTAEGVPYRAWLLMNETMDRVAGGRYESWRLFQIAFILATLPSIVSRMSEYQQDYDHDIDDATTLLYFATGGGKSEAFFGLLVFNIFFDRLRGKKFGITAMIRYPLRLLTIQQAQRASKVLAHAEIVRREAGIDGAPFGIGFWVGGGNTPNNHKVSGVSDIPYFDQNKLSEEDLTRKNRKYRNARSDWRKLPDCPYCSQPTGLRRFRASGKALSHGTLGHVCFNTKCDWNRQNSSHDPLPFWIVDADIYAHAPAVILGTIDKLALIGHSPTTIRRVLNMFGLAPWHEQNTNRLVTPGVSQLTQGANENNAEELFPCYPQGRQLFYDPFPSLLIQDEAHLLEESLGTFAGLFETTLLEVFRQLANFLPTVARTESGIVRMPKVVAATATVSDPERQIENLYQKKLVQFPYPGPRLYESFYAAPVVSEVTDRKNFDNIELSSKRRRIYATILTNGKPHTTASVAVLSAFHSTISYLTHLFKSENEDTQNLAKSAMSVALQNEQLGVYYQQAINDAEPSELLTLVDLHRIALTYVTNKKGGDQILSAEWEQVRKDHKKEKLTISDFKKRLVTGSVDAGLIQNVIEEASARPDPGQEFDSLDNTLRSIVATSAISHGVDVEELNSMFFAGMPSDIAEYIQASSRVGRAHVGFSLLLPVPQRKRDRYIVETHDIFHRFLERMIQPPAIDRWAENALRRVIPSFFQTYIVTNIAIPRLLKAGFNEKHKIPEFGRVSDILNSNPDTVVFRKSIVEFIDKGIGLDSDYAPSNAEYYNKLVEDRVRELFDDLQDPDMYNLTLQEFFKKKAQRSPKTLENPMTSLRDVDVPGYIVPYPSATGNRSNRQLDSESFSDLMRILRRGAGGLD